jgi:rfaE bifunctional protein nucleotidyltransferase chain/domain
VVADPADGSAERGAAPGGKVDDGGVTPLPVAAPRGQVADGGLMPLPVAARCCEAWRARGLRVVLTNGCFDLVHVGHVRYLAAARGLGDRLVVALNDDESTRRLKGPGRPIVPLGDRAEVLCALAAVDAVVPFGGATAVDVVRALRPDVYVKGADYDGRANRPPEADVAESVGARVVFLPYAAGRSTTDLIARVRGLPR